METEENKEDKVSAKERMLYELKDKYLGEIGELKRQKGDMTFEKDYEKEIIAENIVINYFPNNLRNRDMAVKAMFEFIQALKELEKQDRLREAERNKKKRR